jgi:hypothetical protein
MQIAPSCFPLDSLPLAVGLAVDVQPPYGPVVARPQRKRPAACTTGQRHFL